MCMGQIPDSIIPTGIQLVQIEFHFGSIYYGYFSESIYLKIAIRISVYILHILIISQRLHTGIMLRLSGILVLHQQLQLYTTNTKKQKSNCQTADLKAVKLIKQH